MENINIIQENLNIIGAFAIGMTSGVIIPIINTIFSNWRKNAPLRRQRRLENKLARIERKKQRELNK